MPEVYNPPDSEETRGGDESPILLNESGANGACTCVVCRRGRAERERDNRAFRIEPVETDNRAFSGTRLEDLERDELLEPAQSPYIGPDNIYSDNGYRYGTSNYVRFQREMDTMLEEYNRREREEEEIRNNQLRALRCVHCSSNGVDRRIVDLATQTDMRYQTHRAGEPGLTLVCYDCLNTWYYTCNSCDNMVGNNDVCPNCPENTNLYETDDDDDLSVSSERCGYCYNCTRSRRCDNVTIVHSYSYKPTPHFFGKGPVYMGFELEVAYGQYAEDSRTSPDEYAVSELGKLGYLKEDSSISGGGFEIVTHPMSYSFAMSKFPWDMLSELSDMGMYAASSCGLHVHVSKTAFADKKHIYRWMKFFYRNETNITAIARRNSDEWAKFSPIAREDIKNYAKGKRGSDRYNAINTTNRTTFEIRIFASSLREAEIKAALGLVDASVEYTRNLTTSDILRNKGWEWQSFQTWLTDEYAPLRSEADKLCVC